LQAATAENEVQSLALLPLRWRMDPPRWPAERQALLWQRATMRQRLMIPRPLREQSRTMPPQAAAVAWQQ